MISTPVFDSALPILMPNENPAAFNCAEGYERDA